MFFTKAKESLNGRRLILGTESRLSLSRLDTISEATEQPAKRDMNMYTCLNWAIPGQAVSTTWHSEVVSTYL